MLPASHAFEYLDHCLMKGSHFSRRRFIVKDESSVRRQKGLFMIVTKSSSWTRDFRNRDQDLTNLAKDGLSDDLPLAIDPRLIRSLRKRLPLFRATFESKHTVAPLD